MSDMSDSFLKDAWREAEMDDSLDSPLAQSITGSEGVSPLDLPEISREEQTLRHRITLQSRAMFMYAKKACQGCEVQGWANDLWNRIKEKNEGNVSDNEIALAATQDPAIHQIEAAVRERLETQGTAAVQKRTKGLPTIARLNDFLAQNQDERELAESL